MKLQTKKIIAREFLILFATSIIGLVSYLCVFPYNFFRQHKVDNLNDTILSKTKLADSLSKSYKIKTAKQFWFTDKYIKKYADLPKSREQANYKIWYNFDDWLNHDGIIYNWEKVWSKEFITFLKANEFENANDFQKFIRQNIITTTDSVNNKNAEIFYTETNKLNTQRDYLHTKLLSSSNQHHLALSVFWISLIILFGVRYIYYVIKWSIKTLQQKTE